MTELFYKSKPMIGLDISRTDIRVMSVDKTKMLVHGYGSIDLDPTKYTDDAKQSRDYLLDRLEVLFRDNITGRLDSKRAVLGIPASKTFTRTFSLPADKESSIRDAINLETEQYIPMPLESLYLDHEIIKRTKKDLTVLTCAAPRPFIDTLIEIVSEAGIDVAMIEPSISSVARLLVTTSESSGLASIIVDIGPVSSDIAIFDSDIRVATSLPVGSNTLTLDIAKHMNIPLETAHQLKVLSGLSMGPRQAKITASLRPSLMNLVKETSKVIRFYTDRFPNENKLEQLLIVGSGSNIPGLGDFFTDELVMPARLASPWQELRFDKIEPPSKALRPRFMAAAGLALIQPEELR